MAKVLRSSRLREVLRRSWLGHPPHPLIVIMPIGARVCASALDVRAGNEKATRRLTGTGLAATPPTVLLGLVDYDGLGPQQQRVGVVAGSALRRQQRAPVRGAPIHPPGR
ncbi:DUF2231 domain-containing protein [Lentzea nigeriaca]|uniref:hypothetical protein n=1 Tax=Lentzea nigeriaca TaxID=1128665 RepID=UPI00195A9B6A|nr:hypothetical protein [Lentzea nigeriaca]MBM7860654.1 hypothetical protein [Lentzea nigeriaca]